MDSIRRTLRTHHYSYRTEQAYLHWVKRFIFYHNKRHPHDMGAREVGEFLSYLANERNVAAATQNQALNALNFLYARVLDAPIGQLHGVTRAKRPKRLPVVLSRNEVNCLLNHLEGIYFTIASVMYGSGLRLMECLRLRLKDLDFENNTITVRDGGTISITATSSPPSRVRCARPVSPSQPVAIRSGTHSPLICWKTATTSVRCRNYSVTRMCAPRRSTRMS
jgi:integrase